MVVSGTVDPRFAPVREAFEENFTSRGEIGAACCVVVEGRRVVDLWGGARSLDRRLDWEPDTLVNVFSIGKGVAAACVARLVGEGRLDLDSPVSAYWPEFAAAGKGAVTLRELCSHQAGLPAVRERLPEGAMLDHDQMATALAAERPWWEPGTAHGYHVNTFGFLVGEVVRRVTGTTLGRFLADEVAGPIGAEIAIGLPAPAHDTVAEFEWPLPAAAGLPADGTTEHEQMLHHTYWNPSGLSGAGVVNTPEWRAAELPSTNGHASARGVARLYEALAAGGTVDGHRVVDAGALAACTAEQVDGDDLVLGRPSRFAVGFQLSQPERPLGPSGRGFGHFGAGGSVGFCDPETGVAFAYVMNQMGPRWQNPRNRALIDAVFSSMS